MGREIERKYRVKDTAWQGLADGVLYRQGYIPTVDARTVRVRVAGSQGYLTLKGPAVNLVRAEFEYEIPLQDANDLLDQLCEPPLIEKRRYRVTVHNKLWEIDEFLGANQGLILAEVELGSPDESITLPDWIGEEVTSDPRYLNVNLARHPYQSWATSDNESS